MTKRTGHSPKRSRPRAGHPLPDPRLSDAEFLALLAFVGTVDEER